MSFIRKILSFIFGQKFQPQTTEESKESKPVVEEPTVVPKPVVEEKPAEEPIVEEEPIITPSNDKTMAKLDLSKIIVETFPRDQYYEAVHTKKQIYLHHTVSGVGVKGDIKYWAQSAERVATCIIIDHDGGIHQVFSSKFWAHHLGIKGAHFKKFGLPNINTQLNQQSIGIEIDSYGGLKKENGVWKTVYGQIIPNENVVEYPEGFRGYYAYEKYTDAQIESVRQLLVFWNERYGIPLDYNEDMWDLNKDALSGKEGIWAHVSVRPDKSDVHPQEELIDMLKSLK